MEVNNINISNICNQVPGGVQFYVIVNDGIEIPCFVTDGFLGGIHCSIYNLSIEDKFKESKDTFLSTIINNIENGETDIQIG